MGRELKRVPLDFSWPHDKPWQGFINPHYEKSSACPHCEHGYSPEYKALQDKWYGYVPFTPEHPFPPNHPNIVARSMRNNNFSYEWPDGDLEIKEKPKADQWHPTVFEADTGYPNIDNAPWAVRRECERLAALFNGQWSHHLNQEDVDALVADGRLMDFTHTFTAGKGWERDENKPHPTAKQVNEWSIGWGIGHDSCNCWVVIKHNLAKEGKPTACVHCGGDGRTWPEGVKELYESWEREEPPKGEGYQIWETVSEGSPISPVFATAHDLATFMAGKRWGADRGSSYESWMQFIEGPGWAPSMMMLHTAEGSATYEGPTRRPCSTAASRSASADRRSVSRPTPSPRPRSRPS